MGKVDQLDHMTTLVAQIAPQRSTQYAEMVTKLAPYELMLSTLGSHITGDIQHVTLGSQNYLKFQIDTDLDDALKTTIGHLVMTDGYFEYLDAIGTTDGPFLKPIDNPTHTFLPSSLIATRRYRGKTNELFTQFMCNIARYSSDHSTTPWHKLTLLDPLAGGGTTLFAGLMLGADVIGVEQDKKVVEGTVAFMKQYTKEGKIPATYRQDRFKNIGKRTFITINQSARCAIGHGDTRQVKQFIHGLKQPQLIVTDLPYGIQHHADWQDMLESSLPAWADVLVAGGVLVFSWNATHFPREHMVKLVERVSRFKVQNTPPYTDLSHQVDRVIKHRDVIVARL